MCQEINYIRAVIDNYDISLTWLAKRINEKDAKIGMTKQRLFYIKESGKEISTTLYKQIRAVLDEHNFILSDFDEAPSISRMVSALNTESAHLVNTAMESLVDLVVNDEERADIILQVALIRQRCDKLDEFLGTNK